VAEEPARSAAPSFKRYNYSNPIKPITGNRAEAERLFQSALTARNSFRLGDAEKLYRQAIAQDPAFFTAHFNLALVLADLGDLQEAARSYETALALRPDSTDARYNFALVLRQLNHPLDAVNELGKLLAERPDDVRAHVALGNIYTQQLSQNSKAREHYTKALAADPNNPQAGAIRAWLADPRH
jgi:tetratricopeptide (TPR) repeat protein